MEAPFASSHAELRAQENILLNKLFKIFELLIFCNKKIVTNNIKQPKQLISNPKINYHILFPLSITTCLQLGVPQFLKSDGNKVKV